MAINDPADRQDLLRALSGNDWSVTLEAVNAAERALRDTIVGDAHSDLVVEKMATLANHPKWEVRRAVANAAAHLPHPAFEAPLAKLALDDNSRVRLAAEQAALRRRDSRHASSLGKQHEDRINSILDDIAARFGPKGRDAVRRAANEIANIFARELYHEVIRLLSPLAVSAETLRTQLLDANLPGESLVDEAARMGRRVAQLRNVLDAMRAYTAQPPLSYKAEVLRDVIQEAATVAIESDSKRSRQPAIEIEVSTTLVACVARGRLVQALTNVLVNAIEAYGDADSPKPIKVKARLHHGIVGITVEDSGCGMSEEAQRDALTLFATSKPNGTGFGLPLAVKIVESEHGGRLTLESKKGRGTLVQISVPANTQMDAA
jgi:nitrogen fixation/metabolism regulation signal transduction histidine kinase